MLRRFFSGPRLLLVLGMLAVVLLVIGVLTKHHSSQQPAANPAAVALPTVPIKNIADYPGVHSQFTLSLERQLYSQLKQSVSNIPSSDYGMIRAGSLSTSQTTQVVGDQVDVTVPVTVTTFVIDVPAAKRSYEGQTFQDQYGEVAQAYVLCPTSAENNYGAFYCVNQP